MSNKKEKAAPVISVGADTEQLFNNFLTDIIPEETENFKAFDEFQQGWLRMMEPSYLSTVSMTELYDTVFRNKPPVIDGLLYPGSGFTFFTI
ncbi:MAG: hypothetical protein E7229_07110 [Clostridiales bacterium]|nr:hypothetical protein [Clostridiales bacterium]